MRLLQNLINYCNITMKKNIITKKRMILDTLTGKIEISNHNEVSNMFEITIGNQLMMLCTRDEWNDIVNAIGKAMDCMI